MVGLEVGNNEGTGTFNQSGGTLGDTEIVGLSEAEPSIRPPGTNTMSGLGICLPPENHQLPGPSLGAGVYNLRGGTLSATNIDVGDISDPRNSGTPHISWRPFNGG